MIADLVVPNLMTVSSTASVPQTLVVSGNCGSF